MWKSALCKWAFVLVLGTSFHSPASAGEKALGPQAAEQKIFATLEEQTTLEAVAEPLDLLVARLKDLHGIEIQIDERALKENLLEASVPITKSINGISLASALNLTLRDLDLDWTIVDEVLLITTAHEAELHLVTRVYDVGELVTVRNTEGKLWRDFDSMIDLLTTTVDEESWDQVGGPGSIAPFEFRGAAVLVVCQTPRIQQKVARLVADLNKIAEQFDNGVYPTRDPKPPPTYSGGMAASGGEGKAQTPSAQPDPPKAQ